VLVFAAHSSRPGGPAVCRCSSVIVGFHSNAIACVGKQPIMVAIASTEHSYWLALAFVALAFEWKPGLIVGFVTKYRSFVAKLPSCSLTILYMRIVVHITGLYHSPASCFISSQFVSCFPE